MSEPWIAEPIGPGLWWFAPKEENQTPDPHDVARGPDDQPVLLAWVGGTQGGLFYETVGQGQRREVRSGLGHWAPAELTPPQPPEAA